MRREPDWSQGAAIRAARARVTERHVRSIVGRVHEMHPRDPVKQRRVIERWSRLLSGIDPEVSVALLDAPVRRSA